MKKLLLLIICLSLSSCLFAQVSTGLIGGLNLTKVVSDKSLAPKFNQISSFEFGWVINFNLHEDLSFHLEPIYIEKGGEINISAAFLNPKFTLSMSYIEIPFLLKYTFGKTLRPYIVAGPTVEINLSSEIETELAGFQFIVDTKDLTESIGYGLSFGGGFIYAVEDVVDLFVEARYTVGLNEFTKPGILDLDLNGNSFREEIDYNPELKSKGFQIMLGFMVPISE